MWITFATLCFPLQVKCYHRRAQTADRDTVFRLQFHTCTIHGSQLWFGKGELDQACTGVFICVVYNTERRGKKLQEIAVNRLVVKGFEYCTKCVAERSSPAEIKLLFMSLTALLNYLLLTYSMFQIAKEKFVSYNFWLPLVSFLI